MALVSPGVQVTIIDESFFIPAQAPTVPLLFIATADEKSQPNGLPAAGTYENNVIRTVTSINQSIQLYGIPTFLTNSSGQQLNGDARNEYGLLALNQFLGIGNLAYVVRANVNLNDNLDDIRAMWERKMTEASLVLDADAVAFITEYNEVNNLVPSNPLFKVTLTKDEFLSLAAVATAPIWQSFSFKNCEADFMDDDTVPSLPTAGYQTVNMGSSINVGQQFLNFLSTINSASQVINVGGAVTGLTPTGLANTATVYSLRVYVDGVLNNVSVVGSAAQTYATLLTEINLDLSGATAALLNGNVRIISSSTGTTSAIAILEGVGPDPMLAALTDYLSIETATKGATNPTGLVNDTTSYDLGVDVDGAGIVYVAVQGQNAQTFGDLMVQLNAQIVGATAEIFSDGNIRVFSDLSDATLSSISLTNGVGPNPMLTTLYGYNSTAAATVGGTNPTGLANDATNYTASVTVDGIPYAVQVTGSAAQTFATLIAQINLDITGVATAVIGDGVTATNGIVISNGNIGIVSASTGATSKIVTTDITLFNSLRGYVALGVPVSGQSADAALDVYGNGYDQPPTGTFLGLAGIAAQWVLNSLGSVVPGEWSPEEAAATLLAAADDYQFTVEFLNQTSLGANNAARTVAITTALQASINSNTEVRSESYEFNLILCPGYPECVDELIALCTDISQEAFVIADTPVNLDPDAVVTWAATTLRQTSPDVAYYYPWALQSNVDGVNVVGAPSGVALRTYAFSDEVSEVWFAPAGTRRGLITGVSQLGYVEGVLGTATTFVETNLNQGQRDNMYKDFTNLNPLCFFPGRGFIVWGQKTSSGTDSARNRVNVERLIAFIKRSLRKSLMSFVFEPNDALTRDNVKAMVDSFLADIVIRRGIYDYATLCDETNNTPARIDNNQLWIDVAIKPVKAAEFIFVPITIVATGAQI